MSKEDFRRFGHELIDWISDYFEQIEGLPVLSQIEPGELEGAASLFAAGKRRADAADSGRRRSFDRPRAHALEPSFVLCLLRHLDFRAGNIR